MKGRNEEDGMGWGGLLPEHGVGEEPAKAKRMVNEANKAFEHAIDDEWLRKQREQNESHARALAVMARHRCDCEVCAQSSAICPATTSSLVMEIVELQQALDLLYRETVDYITINHLGDPHHNQSMKLARAALTRGKAVT